MGKNNKIKITKRINTMKKIIKLKENYLIS